MAYVNATINEGDKGSYKSNATAIPLNARVKFIATLDTTTGKPLIDLAGASDRAIGIAREPIAAGDRGMVHHMNSGGEKFGLASGTIGVGVLVYAAALGTLAATGTVIQGISTSPGYDGGAFTFMPLTAAA